MTDDRPIDPVDAPLVAAKQTRKPPTKVKASEDERREDDDEGYDASDDGPVTVSDEQAAGLEAEARSVAELAGFPSTSTAIDPGVTPGTAEV